MMINMAEEMNEPKDVNDLTFEQMERVSYLNELGIDKYKLHKASREKCAVCGRKMHRVNGAWVCKKCRKVINKKE